MQQRRSWDPLPWNDGHGVQDRVHHVVHHSLSTHRCYRHPQYDKHHEGGELSHLILHCNRIGFILPLIVSCGIIVQVLLNKDLIAVNQDPLGKAGGRLIKGQGPCSHCEVWGRQLVNGKMAIALYNSVRV